MLFGRLVRLQGFLAGGLVRMLGIYISHCHILNWSTNPCSLKRDHRILCFSSTSGWVAIINKWLYSKWRYSIAVLKDLYYIILKLSGGLRFGRSLDCCWCVLLVQMAVVLGADLLFVGGQQLAQFLQGLRQWVIVHHRNCFGVGRWSTLVHKFSPLEVVAWKCDCSQSHLATDVNRFIVHNFQAWNRTTGCGDLKTIGALW